MITLLTSAFLVKSNMFIRNIENTSKSFYECGNVVGKFLIKSGVPVLARTDKGMVFAKTKKLQKVINDMPLYLRFLMKVGVING